MSMRFSVTRGHCLAPPCFVVLEAPHLPPLLPAPQLVLIAKAEAPDDPDATLDYFIGMTTRRKSQPTPSCWWTRLCRPCVRRLLLHLQTRSRACGLTGSSASTLTETRSPPSSGPARAQAALVRQRLSPNAPPVSASLRLAPPHAVAEEPLLGLLLGSTRYCLFCAC